MENECNCSEIVYVDMTPINVGINGFDRLSRILFRTCFEYENLQVTAINESNLDLNYICYLIKFDSTHGNFKGTLKQIENGVLINGKKVEIYHHKKPECIPWFLANVDYVIETTGQYTTLKSASLHLGSSLKVKTGIKRVIVTAPCKDIPIIILGVNHNQLTTEMKVVSCASSTLYCLAPVVKVLDDHFGLMEGMMTSVHALTPSLKSLDGNSTKSKHWRDHRGALQNIIPAPSGACRTLARVLPHLDNKLCGLAYRVPVPDVSLLDLTVRLEKSTNLLEIKQRVEEACHSHMKNIITTSDEQTVSSDYKGNKHSCIFDANSSIALNENLFKLVCWYENEYAYACRIAELIIFAEDPSNRPVPMRKVKTRKDHVKGVEITSYGKISNSRTSNNKDFGVPIIERKQTQIKRNVSPFRVHNSSICLNSETSTTDLNHTIKHVNLDMRNQDKFNNTDEARIPSHNKNVTDEFDTRFDKPKYTETGHTKHEVEKKNIERNTTSSICDSTSKTQNSSELTDTSTLTDIQSNDLCEFKKNNIENLTNLHSESSTKLIKEMSQAGEGDLQIIREDKSSIDDVTVEENVQGFVYFVGEMRRGKKQQNQNLKLAENEHLNRNIKFEIEKNYSSEKISNEIKNINPRIENPLYYVNFDERNSCLVMETLSEYKPPTSMSESSKETGTSPISRNRNGTSVVALSEKLASASETGSAFSLNINEKKSMEIKFSDITNSLEDLEKLDKICRIMEISDELSDDLFFKLENEQSDNPTTAEEWSLNKFCEKVQLDNFLKGLSYKNE